MERCGGYSARQVASGSGPGQKHGAGDGAGSIAKGGPLEGFSWWRRVHDWQISEVLVVVDARCMNKAFINAQLDSIYFIHI
jgi:hypothetical protein